MIKLLLMAMVVVSYADDDYSEEEQESEILHQQQNFYAQTQYGCIILTKYHLQERSTELMALFKSIPQEHEKKRAYDKIQAYLVNSCIDKITHEQLAQLFQQLRSQSFKYQDFSDIFMMIDLGFGGDYTLSDEEKIIATEIEAFDKNMQEQQKKQREEAGYDDDDDEEIDPRRRQQPQGYNLFGVDLSKLSGTTQAILFGVLVSTFAVILFVGMKYVQMYTQGPVKKQKKDKKNKKQ